MPQVTTTAHVFPSANDLFGPGVAGDGKTSYEKNLADKWLAFLFAQNCMISGGQLPASSATLMLTIPTGKAYLAGRFVEWQPANITFPASTTSHLWVRVLRDGNTNANSVVIEYNTTGTDPASADTTKLGTVTTSASAVTSTVDNRSFAFIDQARIIKPSIGTPELIDTAVTTPKLIDGAVTTPKLAAVIAPVSAGLSSSIPNIIVNAQGQVTAASNVGLVVDTANITDGNVTQPKLAKPCVGTPEMKTATGSSTLVGIVSANIDLNDYSFHTSATSALGAGIGVIGHNIRTQYDIGDPGNTVARFRLEADPAGTPSDLTTIRWRYQTASDEPTIWVLADPATGEIKGSRVSDDPVRITEDVYEDDAASGLITKRTLIRVSAIPPITSPRLISQPVPLDTLAQLALPQRALDSADRHIDAAKLNPVNRLYRALQLHARDDAPAAWLQNNIAWDAQGGVIRALSAQEKSQRRPIPKPILGGPNA